MQYHKKGKRHDILYCVSMAHRKVKMIKGGYITESHHLLDVLDGRNIPHSFLISDTPP
jgi:hypothetical protein